MKKSDLRKTASVDSIYDGIKLTIDYTKTLEQAIAASEYNWEGGARGADHFPVSPEMIGKKVEVVIKLFHFHYQHINSEDAISEMDKDGYRPATLMEIITLSALFPKLQKLISTAALGSVLHHTDGYSYVPCLEPFPKCKIYLHWFRCSWTARFQFFGVRK